MAFNAVFRSPTDLPHELLHSTFALELLTETARNLGQSTFAAQMSKVFGNDIPHHTYAALWSSLISGKLESPAIVLTEFLGYEADYHNRERVIRIDWEFFRSALTQRDRHWWVLSALIHEFGHHIDNLLRHDFSDKGADGLPVLAADANHEEGHRFTAWLIKAGAPHQDDIEIASYTDHGNVTRSLSTSWRDARLKMSALPRGVDDTVIDALVDPVRERFEAGHGDANHQTHLQIEKVLEKLDFEFYESESIYFGNWLRDHSQVVDPKLIRPVNVPKNFPDVISREALTRIVDVLSVKQFSIARQQTPKNFTVSEKLLGVYRPTEHMDNPRVDDLGATNPTSLDPAFEPLVHPGDQLLDIDYETSMKRYIQHSVDFMANELSLAMQGRTVDGCRALGSALHVLEDFFAHSNFVELALIKNGHSHVLPWTSTADCRAGLPLVTGTFGAADTVASLTGPLGEALFSPDDIIYKPVKAGERSEREQILLILLAEHHNPTYLEIYQDFLDARDAWVDLPFVDFIQRCARYLQGASAVVGNATGIIMKDVLQQFGENVDNWQTRYGQDPHENGSTDPTHSQLAKDHAEHPLHLIAAELASEAVEKVAIAMVAHWNGDENADPVAVARSYFKHPQDSDWQDSKVIEWAAANPHEVSRSTSKDEMKSISERVAQTSRNVLDRMARDGAAYLNFLRGEIMDQDSPFWIFFKQTAAGSLLFTTLQELGVIRKAAR
jgi:hypothetical protein